MQARTAILLGLALAVGARAPAVEPWLNFRGDMQHTGYTSRTSRVAPILNWSARTSGSIAGSPVMNSSGTLFVASASGHVHAFDRDGVELWAFPTQGAVFGSPTIGPDGTIYAGDLSGRLYAITPGGAQDWIYTISNSNRDARILQAPAVGPDGTIYVCAWDGRVHAVRPAGTQRWTSSRGGYLSASPAVDSSGTIYVAGYNDDNLRVYALNPGDGSEKWRFDRDMGATSYGSFRTYVKSSVCVNEARDRVYVGANCPDNGFFACLNRSNGAAVQWRSLSHSVYSAPSVDPSGTVYFGDLNGRLFAYDPETWTEKWRFQTDGLFILGSPLVDGDGNVYVGSSDACLYKIGTDGREIWRYPTRADVRSTPVIDENGALYFGSMDTRLYSLGGPSAVRRWRRY